MNAPPLLPAELEMVRAVLRRHPEVETATLFGSRAKGTHSPRSDVDLVVAGPVEPLRAEAIAAELDALPLPYRFEVQPLAHIQHAPLLEHIRRVGIVDYPATDGLDQRGG
jgi:predicted nucleotidyltransferase